MSASNSADPQLQQLAYAAQSAMQSGRLDEAARLWERVLASNPAHAEALLRVGQHALMRHEVVAAKSLLERASAAAPRDPIAALNLAFAYRAAGEASAEMVALDRALSADPYFYPALLSKGALLERMGSTRRAAKVYTDLLSFAPPLNQVPPELQSQLKHAKDVSEANLQELDAFLSGRLGNIRSETGALADSRFDECRDVMLGKKKIYTPQPTMLHFPRLPVHQFYDNAEFPWLAEIEEATAIIRDELIALVESEAKGFSPYVNHPAGVPLNQWEELNHSPRWSAYFLYEDGKRIEEHCAQCPRTAAITERAPLVAIPRIAPAVFFSTLAPHTRIPPHTGVTNTRLVVHLPLIVPPNCGFRVGNELRAWEPGRAWVFDDTLEHEAWNDSDKQRVILIFDIWNPYLSSMERELVAELLVATGEYYRAV